MAIIDPEYEKDLLLRLRNGDHTAFERIYDQYADLLAFKLNKLVKIPETAEELHQDIFLRLWSAREQLAEDTNHPDRDGHEGDWSVDFCDGV